MISLRSLEEKNRNVISLNEVLLSFRSFFVCFETISKLPEWEKINSHMFNTILHLQNVFSRILFFN